MKNAIRQRAKNPAGGIAGNGRESGNCSGCEVENVNTQEWQLHIRETGGIFVQHLTLPRFTTQIIIQAGQPDPCVSFKSKWEHPKLNEMEWYFKALDFYHNAPKPK
jgi:hypothetical protein